MLAFFSACRIDLRTTTVENSGPSARSSSMLVVSERYFLISLGASFIEYGVEGSRMTVRARDSTGVREGVLGEGEIGD